MNQGCKLVLNYLAGIPWVPALVEPLFYQGVIAASEFTVYDVDKLYLCSDVEFGNAGGANNGRGMITFHDEGNAINMYLQNNSIAYESVAIAIFYTKNNSVLENSYFSRIIAVQVTYMKFNGWRLTR